MEKEKKKEKQAIKNEGERKGRGARQVRVAIIIAIAIKKKQIAKWCRIKQSRIEYTRDNTLQQSRVAKNKEEKAINLLANFQYVRAF